MLPKHSRITSSTLSYSASIIITIIQSNLRNLKSTSGSAKPKLMMARPIYQLVLSGICHKRKNLGNNRGSDASMGEGC